MDEKGLNPNINETFEIKPHQKWICDYLDRLNEKEKICSDAVIPSNLIIGALIAIHNKEKNPDWMAQSAHSYREIFYWLGGKRDKGVFFKIKSFSYGWLHKLGIRNKAIERIVNYKINSQNKKKIEYVLQVLHEQKRAEIIANTLYKIYLAFTKISHHFAKKDSRKDTIKIFRQLGIIVDEKNFPTNDNFIDLVRIFENVLRESSLDPLKIHENIDLFIKERNKDAPYLRLLFSLNYDAKRFFFYQADENWLSWLWKNGFLDNIKKKAENSNQYSFRMPELNYLVKVTEKKPVEVIEIIKSIEISGQNFNPEVVDRFLWIARSLPVDKVGELVEGGRIGKWIYLMHAYNFRKSGYEFMEIIKNIEKAKEYKALLGLAKSLLSIKKEIKNDTESFGEDNPFYIADLDASGVFSALADIDNDEHTESALILTVEKLSEIVKLGGVNNEKVFDYQDLFSLLDVDIFTLEVEESGGISYRQDVKNLVATIKKLIERTIGNNCGDEKKARKMFEHINNLSSCRSSWRIKLFALSQCPEVFKRELKEAFFRVFIDDYYQIEGGTEYKKTLGTAFYVLEKTDRQKYIDKVFEFFSKKDAEKENDKEVWHRRTGWEILSVIYSIGLLNKEYENKCEQVFGKKPKKDYEPEPVIGETRGGTVIDRSPFELAGFSTDQIAVNLKSEWTVKKIADLYKNDDFLRPRNAEGLGDALKEDIKVRTTEYLENINKFFDREKMHSHYVYSILRGIDDILRNKQQLKPEQIKQIFDFFKIIISSGKKEAFIAEKSENGWLADWITVCRTMTDILLYTTENKETRKEIHSDHKEFIKNCIAYLLTITQSLSAEEEKPEYGELYTVAINSVRGRAYELLVVFTENDGNVLSDDVKSIFKKTLKDNSLAVRFVIGRYLATLYFRDKDFVKGLFSDIFTIKNSDKKDVYLATWEGYLSSSLYGELFNELKEYYVNAINFNPEEYTKRKYYKGLDEALAIHLALAFIYLDLKIGDPLFEEFWKAENTKRQEEFISFIGQKCFSRNNFEYGEEDKFDRNKMIEFWNWALNKKLNPKILSGFGFWVNPKKEIIDDNLLADKIAETMEQSDGDIDWDYGIIERLLKFAEKNKEKTLQIIKNYFLDEDNNLNQHRRVPMFSTDNEIKEALKYIYNNSDSEVKEKVEALIGLLIEKGSDMFWGLKEIINKSN